MERGVIVERWIWYQDEGFLVWAGLITLAITYVLIRSAVYGGVLDALRERARDLKWEAANHKSIDERGIRFPGWVIALMAAAVILLLVVLRVKGYL